MSSYCLTLSDKAKTFSIKKNTLLWVGHIHGADSPKVCVEVKGAWAEAAKRGDALGLDAPSFAVPLPLWDELAKRCNREETIPLICSGKITDMRWKNALLHVYQQNGANILCSADTPQKISKVKDVRTLLCVEGVVCYLSATHLCALDSWKIQLSTDMTYSLPKPLLDSDGISLLAMKREERRYSVQVDIFTPKGKKIASASGSVLVEPHSFAYRNGQIWLISRYDVCGLETDTAPHRKEIRVEKSVHGGGYGYDSPMIGAWLAIPGPNVTYPDTLCWLNLETSETRTMPWERVDIWHVHNETLYAIGGGRLMWAAPTQETQKDTEYFCTDVAFGAHEWRANFDGCYRDNKKFSDEKPYSVVAFPFGAVFFGFHNWMVVRHDTEVVHRSTEGEQRGSVSHYSIGENRFALSNGNDVGIFDEKGSLLYLVRMPKTGRLVGATSSCFLFGNWDGLAKDAEDTQLVAIHKDGLGCSKIIGTQWFGSMHTNYAGEITKQHAVIVDEVVYLCSREGELFCWKPEIEGILLAMPERREAVRNVKNVRPSSSNPMDAWPEPGFESKGDSQFVLQSTFGGSTGYAPAPAIDVQSGATITFAHCRFEAGEIKLRNHSTVFLISCTESMSEDIAESSFVVRL